MLDRTYEEEDPKLVVVTAEFTAEPTDEVIAGLVRFQEGDRPYRLFRS